MNDAHDVILTLFYSRADPASLRTLAALRDAARRGPEWLGAREIERGESPLCFERERVTGVPVIDASRGGIARGRYYGEQSAEQLLAIAHEALALRPPDP